MAGGRRNRGQHGGRNVSGARVWLEVGKTEDCDGSNVSGARMWMEVEATEDSMVDAMHKEQGCGWR